MYTLADLSNEIVGKKDLYRNKDDFWRKKLKDFIFNKYICIMYKLNNDL